MSDPCTVLEQFTDDVINAIKKANEEGLTKSDSLEYQESLKIYEQEKEAYLKEKEKSFLEKKKKGAMNKLKDELFKETFTNSDDELDDCEFSNEEEIAKRAKAKAKTMKDNKNKKTKATKKKTKYSPGTKKKPIELSESEWSEISDSGSDLPPASPFHKSKRPHESEDSDTTQSHYFEKKRKAK